MAAGADAYVLHEALELGGGGLGFKSSFVAKLAVFPGKSGFLSTTCLLQNVRVDWHAFYDCEDAAPNPQLQGVPRQQGSLSGPTGYKHTVAET